MTVLYLAAGAALTLAGIWLALAQLKTYNKGEKEDRDAGYKRVGVGIICIIIGIIIILRFL